MLSDLAPAGQLIQARGLREVARRPGPPEVVVVVVARGGIGVALAARGRLAGEVVEIGLPECAVSGTSRRPSSRRPSGSSAPRPSAPGAD